MSQIYGIINITEFLKASSLTNYVYQQVTLSDWNVNSLISSKFVGIGLQGIISDENFSFDDYGYILHVNGSSYFQDFCKFNDNIYVENDVNINNNLNVNGNTQINTLSVNNLSIYNSATINNVSINNLDVTDSLNINCQATFYNNVSILGVTEINNNLIVNDNIYVNDSINVSNNIDISNNLIVHNNISTNTLFVNSSSYFNTNISVPIIYVNNAYINTIQNSNISTTNISILNNATIYNNLNVSNHIYSTNFSASNNATINKDLYVNNYAYLKNISVSDNTNTTALFVSGNTSLHNTSLQNATIMNNLLVNGITTLNTTNIDGYSTLKNTLYIRANISNSLIDLVHIGPNSVQKYANNELRLDVDGTAYIDLLYARSIRCDDVANTSKSNIVESTGITSFSIINTTQSNGQPIYGRSVYGSTPSDNIYITHFTAGQICHGIVQSKDPFYVNVSTFFDLKAYNNFDGIIYDGPVNIGSRIENTFNLNASGIINYDGSFNIGQKKLSTLFNLNGNGTINYDGSFNIGQKDINTKINLNGNGIINYDGLFNIGQKNVNTQFNLNGNGIINFNGNTTLSGTLDISASSLTDGIQYNGPVSISSTDALLDLDGMINLYGSLYITKSINNVPVISADGDIDIEGNIMVNGNIQLTSDITIGGNIYSKSDIKIKNNITKLNNCLEKIDNMHGYNYTRNDLIDTEKLHIGLIAQEVESIYPEIISEINNVKTINYNSINAILLECVKELKLELIEIKKELTQLKLK
jgi:hypothetical protein